MACALFDYLQDSDDVAFADAATGADGACDAMIVLVVVTSFIASMMKEKLALACPNKAFCKTILLMAFFGILVGLLL